jgi:signal recognition particle subunit SRP54
MAQLGQVRKMGSLGGLMKLMPGMTKEMRDAAKNVDESQLDRIEAIVRSMTPKERRDPSIIDGSRRTRIARGCGRSVNDVNQLLKQFDQMKKMMKTMGRGGMPQLPGGMGKMASLAARASAASGRELPPGFEALGAGMQTGARPSVSSAGAKSKKKKGGRVTPPKSR